MQENPYLIELTDEDGETVTFEHLDTVQYKGKDYVVFIPYNEDEEEVDEVVIFQILDQEEDCLEQVEDPAVLSAVYDLFRERNADMFDFED
ncbi:MAG: DUF1292 domain-containing protein [Clostridia bacterium]|nr:DUF1292 domain-containing protein [Clostridia bacterium]